MTNFFIKISLSILLISVTVTPVSAQSNQTQEAIGTLGNLFGALAQAGAKSKAKKGWAKISEPVKACVNMTLASRNLTVDQIVAAGVTPTNQQVAPLITFCDQILVAQLQTNVACNVSNSKGQQVASTCNQVFAKDENGTITEISRDDFIRAAGNGEKVQIGIFETSVANAARIDSERRQAAVERERFLASPEGKRQTAAEADRQRKVALEEKARAVTAQKARSLALAEKAKVWAQYDCAGSYTRTVLIDGEWVDINETNIETTMRFAYHRSNPEVQIGGWTRYKQGIWISPDNAVYGRNSVTKSGGIINSYFYHSNGDLSYNSSFNTSNLRIQVQELANGNKSVFTGNCVRKNWMR